MIDIALADGHLPGLMDAIHCCLHGIKTPFEGADGLRPFVGHGDSPDFVYASRLREAHVSLGGWSPDVVSGPLVASRCTRAAPSPLLSGCNRGP